MKKLFFIVSLAVILSGCITKNPELTPSKEDSHFPEPSPITPTATLSLEMQAKLVSIQRQWEESPHAEVENAVDCQNCHQLQNGLPTHVLAWWNERAGKYESVADSADLCLKCHTEYADSKSAHAKKTCIDCHDEHMVKSSCFDCHDQIRMESIQALATPIDGHPGGMVLDCEGSGCHSMATQKAQMTRMGFSIHGTSHANVSCEACHAADDYEVGPTQGENTWVLWRKIKINGEMLLVPYRSHNLQYEVDCTRCHFDGNPWNLPLVEN